MFKSKSFHFILVLLFLLSFIFTFLNELVYEKDSNLFVTKKNEHKPVNETKKTVDRESIKLSLITPTFNQVGPICSDSTLSPLPTISTNGITGTWSPALNNTITTKYTFAPSPGQLATTTTMTITVNRLPNP